MSKNTHFLLNEVEGEYGPEDKLTTPELELWGLC